MPYRSQDASVPAPTGPTPWWVWWLVRTPWILLALAVVYVAECLVLGTGMTGWLLGPRLMIWAGEVSLRARGS